jgi:hypothetical protein
MLFLKIISDKDEELELLDDDYISPIPPELRWQSWAADDEGITGDELISLVNDQLFPTLAKLDLSTGNRRALLIHEVFADNYNYMKKGVHLRQVINKLDASPRPTNPAAPPTPPSIGWCKTTWKPTSPYATMTGGRGACRLTPKGNCDATWRVASWPTGSPAPAVTNAAMIS